MSTQKNTKDSIVFFIIGAIKPFKWLIVGQFIVTVIWAIDMSLSPYLIKVILNKITMILPSQAFDALLLPTTLYIAMGVIVVITFRFYEWILLCFHPSLKKHIGVILMGCMMNHSQNFYQNHFSGSVANKINDVTNGIPNILNTLIDQFFSHALALSIAIYTVWLVDLKLLLVLFSGLLYF